MVDERAKGGHAERGCRATVANTKISEGCGMRAGACCKGVPGDQLSANAVDVSASSSHSPFSVPLICPCMLLLRPSVSISLHVILSLVSALLPW